MPRKLHYLTSSGQDISGEYYSSSACGLTGDTDFEWDGTHKKEKATCKRCITALAKPPERRVSYSEKERPILFSGPMVRAILDGKKTVTRRVMPAWQVPTKSSEPEEDPRYNWIAIAQNHPRWGFAAFGETEQACADELAMYGETPYGRPWQKMWVRETTRADYDTHDGAVLSRYAADNEPVLYWDEFDGEPIQSVSHWDYPRDSRPSIHMKRSACRIILEITDVRAERLQDISEEQAEAEGVDFLRQVPDADETLTAKQLFECLWSSINGADSWDANPWVWAISFKRVTP